MRLKRFFLFAFILINAVMLSAQTGTLKIFSEIKDISIYIDEVYVGRDMAEIKNVQKGTHYLKITKEGIAIYESIVAIEDGAASTIVLKDSPAIQEKLLETKKAEIAKYDSLKLAMDQNMNFYMGTNRLSLSAFSKIIGRFDIEQRIASDNSTANILAGTGTFVLLTGLAGTMLTFSSILLKWPDLPDDIYNALPYIGTASILGCLAGYVMVNSSSEMANSHTSKYISFEEAAKAIKIYNDDLKKKLGVPETYNK